MEPEKLAKTRWLTINELRNSRTFTFDPVELDQTLVIPFAKECVEVFAFVGNYSDDKLLTVEIRDQGGPVGVIPPGKSALIWSDGIAWFGLLGSRAF
jgi:hypothetical protein